MASKRVSARSKRETFSKKDAAYHTVYYRATQVTYSAPCFEEMRVPKVGMRLAMLHPEGEFSGALPEERFYPGRIAKVERLHEDDHMVTVEFDPPMPATRTMTLGWNYFGKFCVPLREDRERFQKRLKRSK